MTAPRRAVVASDADDVPVMRVRRLASGGETERQSRVEALTARMDAPVSALGVVFALVVLGQTLATDATLQRLLAALSWALWTVFVAEFALRLYVAPSRKRFLARNWWQLIFLVLPMLRFVRLLLVMRMLRAGRVVSSAVRSSRSASRVLSNRLGWLAVVSGIVVLTASQLLYVLEPTYDSYGDALHGAALAAVTGNPLGRPGAFARVLDVVLAVYSVVVFAGVAGSLGAYFLEERR